MTLKEKIKEIDGHIVNITKALNNQAQINQMILDKLDYMQLALDTYQAKESIKKGNVYTYNDLKQVLESNNEKKEPRGIL